MNTIKKLSMATVGVALIGLGTSGTAQAGILGGQLFSTWGDVEVQILLSTAAYNVFVLESIPFGGYNLNEIYQGIYYSNWNRFSYTKNYQCCPSC
jgi:hypothetical protein